MRVVSGGPIWRRYVGQNSVPMEDVVKRWLPSRIGWRSTGWLIVEIYPKRHRQQLMACCRIRSVRQHSSSLQKGYSHDPSATRPCRSPPHGRIRTFRQADGFQQLYRATPSLSPAHGQTLRSATTQAPLSASTLCTGCISLSGRAQHFIRRGANISSHAYQISFTTKKKGRCP